MKSHDQPVRTGIEHDPISNQVHRGKADFQFRKGPVLIFGDDLVPTENLCDKRSFDDLLYRRHQTVLRDKPHRSNA